MTNYSSIVLRHFHHPRNVGEASPCDGAGEATIAHVAMRMSVSVAEGRLREVRFRSSSCVAAVAACSMLTEMASGLTVDDARALSSAGLAEVLAEVPSHLNDRCTAAIAALQAALDDSERRAADLVPSTEEVTE